MALIYNLVRRLDHSWLVARYRLVGARGSWWDDRGPAQLEFLKTEGLEPCHDFLDIGCGPLRGGIPIIRYLGKRRYFGIEKESSLIRAARWIELPRHGLVHKKPILRQIDDFDVSSLGATFDYMIAFSVLNHLQAHQVEHALKSLVPYLKPDGAFYCDYNEGDHGFTRVHPWRQGEVKKSFFPFSFFTQLGKKYGFKARRITGWKDVQPDRQCLKITR